MIFSLFEKATPAPVNNFLDYVENRTYKNNVFHRSVTNDGMSIIQSGSFTLSETRLTSNLTKDPIINAPGIPNTKGTIAYARTSIRMVPPVDGISTPVIAPDWIQEIATRSSEELLMGPYQ